MGSYVDFDRRIVAARISAPARKATVNDERVAAAFDCNAVDGVRRTSRASKWRDASRNHDLERAFDPNLFETGDPEVTGRRSGWRNGSRRSRNDNEEGAHAATLLQHG